MRLLRSQLRTKSSLRVIDADVMPLIEVAQEQNKAAAESEAAADRVSDASSSTRTPPTERWRRRPAIGSAAEDQGEKDLEPYERLFANTAYWKRIGEEYQNPLIVTGTVLFTPQHVSGFVQRDRKCTTVSAAAACVPIRTYMERKGFVLRPKFVFIDGRTGATMLLGDAPRGSALQRAAEHAGAVVVLRADGPLVPDFLGTLSSQKIKGTRILLK